MSEPEAPGIEPAGPEATSEGTKGDIKEATAWLLANRDRYTEPALLEELRGSGYTEEEIAAISAEAARLAPPPPLEPAHRDLRAIAAVIVIVGFLGVWAYLSIPWLFPPADANGFPGATGAAILATLLGLIGLTTLFFIFDSERLRRGTAGALVAVLAVPFLLLFVVAGLCVATTGGFNG
jgi:hypothetical protein